MKRLSAALLAALAFCAITLEARTVLAAATSVDTTIVPEQAAAVSGETAKAADVAENPAGAAVAPVETAQVPDKTVQTPDAAAAPDGTAQATDESAEDSDEPVVLTELTGSFFTAVAPQGEWFVEETAPNSAAIVADDRSCFVSVDVWDARTATLAETAASLAASCGSGVSLRRLEGEDEVWEFRGTSAGRPLYAQVFTLDKRRAASIAIVGDPDAPDARGVFNSIRFK